MVQYPVIFSTSQMKCANERCAHFSLCRKVNLVLRLMMIFLTSVAHLVCKMLYTSYLANLLTGGKWRHATQSYAYLFGNPTVSQRAYSYVSA